MSSQRPEIIGTPSPMWMAPNAGTFVSHIGTNHPEETR